ncbi:MAG: hypothetical protein HFH08_06650 [Bacilli bacterium]|nr:hypothetical protein [Bacilli bacterium]
MIKLFMSSSYKVKHSEINEKNILEKLKNDIRSKLLGDVEKFVYPSSGTSLKSNSNIVYVGGFYYEESTGENSQYGECENIVQAELEQIDRSDLVVVSLLNYSAIATITELIYAAFKKKKIIIFCDPNITKFEVEYEYWFPIITALKENQRNIEIQFVKSEDDIIDYINHYKEEEK